jgi:hypothetical protein
MVAALIDVTESSNAPLDGFLIMLYSASSERAAEIGRQQLENHYHKILTAALGGSLAPQRAAVVLALVAGIQIMRQMIGLTALTDAEPADLRAILEPLFRQLFANDAGTPQPPI